MEPRYSLRFESGERRGETIPITSNDFTVGRRPGNSLQILDNSVSGQHAEFAIDDLGVKLKDLGSTNGTRVGDLRVIEQRLSHGDHVHLGNVEVVLLDARLGGAATALEALAKTKTVPGPDGVQRVSAELVARSRKASRPGLILVALAVVAGGVYWWLDRGGGGGGPALRAPEPVAGDLLADEYSFEADGDTWSSAENAPQAFYKSAQARRSGATGISADLAAGEWALHRSREVRVGPGRELAAQGVVRANGGAIGRLGIEFSRGASDAGAGPNATGGPAPFVAWSAPLSESGFEERQVAALCPPGYDTARAVVLGRVAAGADGGSVAADDVSLVERAGEAKPLAQVTEYRLYALGEPPTAVQLVKGDRVLLSQLELTRSGATPGWEGVPLSATGGPSTIALSASDPHDTASMRVETALVAGGIATIGADGFKTHGADFERAGVQDLLLGGRGDFVRIQLDGPARVRGAGEGGAVRVTIDGAPLAKLVLQLEFKEERQQAGNLAHAARAAEKKGELGECLKQWGDLLDHFPYESELVAEAEAARARLLQKGLAELREVRAESERARFFRLVDLYRQCREKAAAVGRRYAESEVDQEARALVADVEKDLAGLEADLDQTERRRLGAILQVLEAQKATGLAGEVREYLDRPRGEGRRPVGGRSN